MISFLFNSVLLKRPVIYLSSIILSLMSFCTDNFASALEKTNSINNKIIMETKLKENDLYAISACLMDADSGRVLYDKNAREIRPMASTTKIMTLILALEYGNMEDIVEISEYAASMPDVQLDAKAGEKYYLKDLLYAMMLESYNDVSVAIAEHIGRSYEESFDINENDNKDSRYYVSIFAKQMNCKAKSIGAESTYFITPNGLDATDDYGTHSSTAKDMALIASYGIKNEDFLSIVNTSKYDIREINGKREKYVYNHNNFLSMMSGACGIKTGYTNNAGYCFVGALKMDGRTFVSVVLGSGWPYNRGYKWQDTRKLMQYGINNYFYADIFDGKTLDKKVKIIDGLSSEVSVYVSEDYGTLLKEDDMVSVKYYLSEMVKAPVYKDDIVGKVCIMINDEGVATYDIKICETVLKKDFNYYLHQVISSFIMY